MYECIAQANLSLCGSEVCRVKRLRWITEDHDVDSIPFDRRDFKNVTGSYETYPGQSPAPTGATENSPARSRGASEPKGKCRVSYESGTLPRCRRPERSRRRSHNKTFKRSFGKPCSWRVYGELWFPITAMTRDHAAISAILHGVPGAFVFLLQTNTLTPNRPLGHAEISTGSPRVFHWVTQGFAWVTQAFFLLRTARPLRLVPRLSDHCESGDLGDLHPPGTHSSPVIPTHRWGWALDPGRSVKQRVAIQAARRFNGRISSPSEAYPCWLNAEH